MSPGILVASNRGPVSFVEEDGRLRATRGGGGLVTALTGVVHETEGMWIAAAMSEGDRRRIEGVPHGRIEVVLEDEKYRLRLLSFDPETYERFYNTVSNRLLWFLHHYLWDVPRWPRFGTPSRISWDAYRTVNLAFAEALAEEAGESGATALIQDYHLSLVPAQLRARAPETKVAYFHHCPFAGPGYMRLVPTWLREEMLDGLLGADLVGFQSARWAEDFLFSARMLPDAEIDLERRTVTWRGRETKVGVYPITVDPEPMREHAASQAVETKRQKLAEWRGDRKLLLRVDRAELSKNILRGFLAFEDLLQRHPEWRERVVFLAHITPSRTALPEYQTYTQQCIDVATRINDEMGTPGWIPIQIDMSDDLDQAYAAYGLYDVLLVNPVFDGMNLVAKEGPLLNEGHGVLVLSRNAGAIAELDRWALPVDPVDIAGTADALHAALEMPDEERRARARGLRAAAEARTPADWIGEQLRDLG
ncbi:MAG TPA: trehalose-6-phosphate synthase [Actinomycetota bacterium]